MRPQQQGRRSRNRGGGRRNQNPLQRSYESNGPDVKIRGNAQVIADKYATLARDALSSGDTVMAENYLQHAEHYNRIILAAQPQPRETEDDSEQSGRDEARGEGSDQSQEQRRDRDNRRPPNGAAQARDGEANAPEGGDQPVIVGTPAEVRVEQDESVSDAAKPKRPRQRRPRKKPDEGAQPETAAQDTVAQEAAPQEPAEETAKPADDAPETPVAAE